MKKTIDIEQLKFPIGVFKKPHSISETDLKNWIATLEDFPSRINKIAKGLSIEQLNLIYRPDGWSIKQVIHHLADSHMNCLIRCKLALTEENPTIKPYDEAKWALLADGNDNDIQPSLLLIEGIHKRLTLLLKSLDESHFNRTYFHSGSNTTYQVKEVVALYAWHCNHHLAHIEQALMYKEVFN